MSTKSDLQVLLDQGVAEGEELGRLRGISQERARIRAEVRKIDGIFIGGPMTGGLIMEGRMVQSMKEPTVAGAIIKAIGCCEAP